MKNNKNKYLLKSSPIILTALSLTSCVPTILTVGAIETYKHAHKSKPNIIFILADDLGYGDLSFMGQTKFSTPNIDSLAAHGVTFTQHYSGSSVSAPSRSCLITGQHTGHTIIRGNKELEEEGQYPIPENTYTIFKMFKENGYKTSVFGKWGLGGPNTEGAPENQNVDEFFGYNCQRIAHNYYPYHLWHNEDKVVLEGNNGMDENDYAPYIIHDKAIDFIRENKDSTFFMLYSTVLPHAELKVPQDVLDDYIGKENLEAEKSYKGCDDGPYYKNGGYASQEFTHAAFAAMMSVLDKQVGEICELIDSLGIAENTIIVFTSDNGPHAEGGADPEFFNSNGNLRGIKRDLYEGGIRVPMILRWDNVVEKNTESDHISAFWDFMPTFADIINIDSLQNVDGISFLPELKGNADKQAEHDYLYWEFHEYGGRQAIRKGDWKAVKYNDTHNHRIELYNLSDDPSESVDISDNHKELVHELDSLMQTARVKSDIFNF
ncbi:MAG: arylsulfatase [Lentimicrobiaceae bacterium]|nr:arylsulfatase [Lentimicrobiaceae bacterium]